MGVGAGWEISSGDRTLSTVSALANGPPSARPTIPTSWLVRTRPGPSTAPTPSRTRKTGLPAPRSRGGGATGNWLTTSHTDNYGSGSLDATVFSGTGDYAGQWGSDGTARDSNTTVDSQTFNITVNYGVGGVAHQRQRHRPSRFFLCSTTARAAPGSGEYSSQQYSASGGQTASSNIDTTWKYDPSGTWRPVSTDELDTGNSTYTYQYAGGVSDPVGGSDQDGNQPRQLFLHRRSDGSSRPINSAIKPPAARTPARARQAAPIMKTTMVTSPITVTISPAGETSNTPATARPGRGPQPKRRREAQ